jgi:hypothetical protein
VKKNPVAKRSMGGMKMYIEKATMKKSKENAGHNLNWLICSNSKGYMVLIADGYIAPHWLGMPPIVTS